MELQSYISKIGSGNDFQSLKDKLKQAPLHLEVRECDGLFALMFSKLSPKDHPLIRQCVGPIFDKKDRILRSYSLDLADELLIDNDDPDWSALENVDLRSSRVIQYTEGIKLTVFFHEKWRISTTRVIDAYRGYWSSSKSFATMFMETCELMFPQIHAQISDNKLQDGPLSKHCSYIFLLSTPDHYCIRKVSSPSLMHLGTFDLQALAYVLHEVGVPKQKCIEFPTVEALKEKVQSLPALHAGYILERAETELAKYPRLRIINKAYKNLQITHGNYSSPIKHYLDIRQMRNNKTIEEMLCILPQLKDIEKCIEYSIHELSRAIHDLYVAFFIRRYQRPVLNKTLFVTLMQLHDEYRSTNIRRSQVIVYRHISNLPAPILYQLLTLTGYGLD